MALRDQASSIGRDPIMSRFVSVLQRFAHLIQGFHLSNRPWSAKTSSKMAVACRGASHCELSHLIVF
jgi:hypothetical protein